MILKIGMICCLKNPGENGLAREAGIPYPDATLVFTGDAVCCRETAAHLYPRVPTVITQKLAGFDYGRFGDKPADELAQDEEYLSWASAGQLASCPDGENPYAFFIRCVRAFQSIVGEMAAKGVETTAIITHNPVISVLMERFCVPRAAYCNWEVAGGRGYLIEFDTLQNAGKIGIRL